jgi:hypothetical protein
MVELVLLITFAVLVTGLLLAGVIEAAVAADRSAPASENDSRVAAPSDARGREGHADEVMVDAANPTQSRSATR